MMHRYNNIYRCLLALTLSLSLVSCADNLDSIFGNDGEIETGEKVQFTTMVPDAVVNSRSAYSEWKEKVDAYKPVNREYTFNIEMFKKGEASVAGTAQYKPDASNLVEGAAISSYDGTLAAYGTPLYWQDNISEWGFKATTMSSETIEADQSNQANWLKQDKLIGYSYLPLWEGTVDGDGYGKDNLDAVNYRTSKQWYADNKKAQDLSGLMADEKEGNNIYKKVPLYMRHQRAWITVILKAGDGVTRSQLAYENTQNSISTYLYSIDSKGTTAITNPWRNQEYVSYPADKNGAAQENASTTRYDAIVEPYNYLQDPEKDIIARINLSNQHFTFSATCDFNYENSKKDITGNAEVDAAKAAMQAYNLQAGQHLVITATLSRASRMVVITAWVEDWTEAVTTTLCDDYGQKGDPVIISSKSELLAFLNSDKNKAGYVGIVAANELDLDGPAVEGGTNVDWNYATPSEGKDGKLYATLNLAGSKLKTKNRLFTEVEGSLINGTIVVKDNATVESVVAEYNEGTIERIDITTASKHSTSKATRGAVVTYNHGTIYQCTSTLKVYGTEVGLEERGNYVGGIAAVSEQCPEHTNVMSTIDGCTVNARVDGISGIKGGGIAGFAQGRISNNTFEYGITLLQGKRATGTGSASDFDFKNIFHTAHEDTRAFNNAWPTEAKNPVLKNSGSQQYPNPNHYSGLIYNQVIDSQEELAALISTTYNIKDSKYRISADFSVGSTENSKKWTFGQSHDVSEINGTNGNIQFDLYGNNKTITLVKNGTKVERWNGTKANDGTKIGSYDTAPMLFSNIFGKIYDLTLELDESIIAEPTHDLTTNNYNAEDAIAALGYCAYGKDVLISNVKVTSSKDKSIEAATPGGVVVWALNGAKLQQDTVRVKVDMWLPNGASRDAKHYAGGVVACAAIATITQCQYTVDSGTLQGLIESAKGDNRYYGGIVGGTSTKNAFRSSSDEIPKLTLTDNSSRYHASVDANKTKGSIIGFSAYINKADNTIKNGMDTNNEGNWWPTSSKGVGYLAEGVTETIAIGKRNSMEPTF